MVFPSDPTKTYTHIDIEWLFPLTAEPVWTIFPMFNSKWSCERKNGCSIFKNTTRINKFLQIMNMNHHFSQWLLNSFHFRKLETCRIEWPPPAAMLGQRPVHRPAASRVSAPPASATSGGECTRGPGSTDIGCSGSLQVGIGWGQISIKSLEQMHTKIHQCINVNEPKVASTYIFKYETV